MKLIRTPFPLSGLQKIAREQFGTLVKAVVDVKKGIMSVGADLHADEETALLDAGSEQAHLWGINLYPELYGSDDFIEFDSMINLRPSSGNMTRGVDDKEIRAKIRSLVSRLITK